MQLVLEHTIRGMPVQWARARIGNGGQKSFHTDVAQKRYKGLVRDEIALAYRSAKARGEHDGKPAPLGVPIIFDARFYLPIPESYTRQEELAAREGRLRPTGKPDLDNWLKLPMDALSGILYADDAQVVGFGESGKFYADTPKLVRLELRVWRLA